MWDPRSRHAAGPCAGLQPPPKDGKGWAPRLSRLAWRQPNGSDSWAETIQSDVYAAAAVLLGREAVGRSGAGQSGLTILDDRESTRLQVRKLPLPKGPRELALDLARKVAGRPSVSSRIKPVMRHLGYDVKAVDKKWGWATAWLPDNLRKQGLDPATIIDVGVARGTPDLYKAFPDAYLVLVEPVKEFEPALQRIVAERPGEYVLVAAGDDDGTATMSVHPRFIMASSLSRVLPPLGQERKPDPEHEREVPVRKLDTLLAEHDWKPPFGLKIDSEGFEYQVIQGAPRLLEQTQFVIAEVVVSRRYEDGYDVASFMSLMYSQGFELCDILDAPRPRRDREIVFFEGLFWKRPDWLGRI
jgi:FkbM family methyltransferase